jgi:hypothetical protein
MKSSCRKVPIKRLEGDFYSPGAFVGAFQKILLILYSRRSEGRLLVNQKKMGITDL